MILTQQFTKFFESEKAGGILLILCTVVSLVLTNTLHDSYTGIWHVQFAGHGIEHWINDGLMAIFFLLIGLELEREIYSGELSSIKNAALPVVAAVGGMLVPAGIFLLFNSGTVTQSGAGIPMATDIAFAIGILSLLGKRVPASLKVLLTAIAVIDDLGAIIVIAVFYTSTISFFNLGIALSIFVFLLLLNRMNVNNLMLYLVSGIFMWYFMTKSGVHATISGVLLAFAIPYRDGSTKSISYILQHFLHKPVAFIIVPLFALANTCIVIKSNWYEGLVSTLSIGVIAGLLIGKPLGISLFSYISVKSKLCALPEDLRWNHILGAGCLAGIGFTMSIFITLLAFDAPDFITESKIAILVASLLSSIVGLIWLKRTLKTSNL